jgi:restriction system protein
MFGIASAGGVSEVSIPDFQTIMLPLLKLLGNGNEHSNSKVTQALADHFQLTQEEQEQLLPSGSQKVFTNRVAWAKADLKMAGLIKSPKRGLSCITQRGQDVLRGGPERIDRKFLKQFPEYREKIGRGNKKCENEQNGAGQTPQEELEMAYQDLRQELSAELLSQVKAGSPGGFEQTVIDLLLAMGYGGTLQDAGQSLGKAGDEGIDGIIKEDRLGLDVIYVQAKKWENPVSRPEIQKFAGALQGKRARKGVFITTSSFSQGAREYAESIESKIVLIDGRELAELMIDYGVGVSTGKVYEVKRIDHDYFEEA